jgi:hypothetical protein
MYYVKTNLDIIILSIEKSKFLQKHKFQCLQQQLLQLFFI